MMYQAEFSDNSVLTLEAQKLADALAIVSDHAWHGEEFVLKSRRSEKVAWINVKRASYWQVNYPDKAAPCSRVR